MTTRDRAATALMENPDMQQMWRNLGGVIVNGPEDKQ